MLYQSRDAVSLLRAALSNGECSTVPRVQVLAISGLRFGFPSSISISSGKKPNGPTNVFGLWLYGVLLLPMSASQSREQFCRAKSQQNSTYLRDGYRLSGAISSGHRPIRHH